MAKQTYVTVIEYFAPVPSIQMAAHESEWVCGRATADLFAPEVLTVSRLDDGKPVKVFAAGTWLSATVFDTNDYPMFRFESTLGKQLSDDRTAAALAHVRQTHYVPSFTTTRNGLEQAACGSFVQPGKYSTEPTCPACAAYLGQVTTILDAMEQKAGVR